MRTPSVNRRQRIRIELRLFPGVAEILYARAALWNVSLSEAGNHLIELGLQQETDRYETR